MVSGGSNMVEILDYGVVCPPPGDGERKLTILAFEERR